MSADEDLKRDVENELKWDPDIDASDIGVAVKDGAVTLSGFARSFRQRRKAEEDATRVRGVRGVANDVEVRLPVEADGNNVVLRGTVRSWAEREEADRVAWLAPGVMRVDNRITVDY